jgi:hypothetical protein
MASLTKSLGVAAVALAASASATSYTLSETYDSTNFLDKFTFFTVSPMRIHGLYAGVWTGLMICRTPIPPAAMFNTKMRPVLRAWGSTRR